MTITTIELAKEAGITPKAIRCAVHRGDLRATRVTKGQGRTASATEFRIRREDADNYLRRRAERKTGVPHSTLIAVQQERRRGNLGAYFENNDQDKQRTEQWKRDALKGNSFAVERLRQPWEQGGVSLLRWWSREKGEIIPQGGRS